MKNMDLSHVLNWHYGISGQREPHPFPRWGSLRSEIVDNLSCRLEHRMSDKLKPEPDLEACEMWEEEALQVNEVARKLVKQKILKLETQVNQCR